MADQSQVPSLRAKTDTVRGFIEGNQTAIMRALPKAIDQRRYLGTLFNLVALNPGLLDCDKRTLVGGMIQSAQLGLELGTSLGHAYLVPFRNRRQGITEATFIIGYKGLMLLARRSQRVSTIEAVIVRSGDVFQYERGTRPFVRHVPSDAPIWGRDEKDAVIERRPVTHVYAVALLRGGGVQFEVMNREEIEWHRDRFARAADKGPWLTDFEEMARKTVARRLCKYLPMSPEVEAAVALDERAEAGVGQGLDALLPPETETDARPELDRLAEAMRAQTAAERAAATVPETVTMPSTIPDEQSIDDVGLSLSEAAAVTPAPVEPARPTFDPRRDAVMDGIEALKKERNLKTVLVEYIVKKHCGTTDQKVADIEALARARDELSRVTATQQTAGTK